MATGIPGLAVMLLPAEGETARETLRDPAPFPGLAGAAIGRLVRQRDARPHDPLTITADATFAQVAAIEERRGALAPGAGALADLRVDGDGSARKAWGSLDEYPVPLQPAPRGRPADRDAS